MKREVSTHGTFDRMTTTFDGVLSDEDLNALDAVAMTALKKKEEV